MELVEYLYVDEKRLDTYVEQISSPVTYDKVPEWNAEISFTGPKGGGKQARFARPFTTHEKISMLTQYLDEKGQVGYGRAGQQDIGTGPIEGRIVFRIETCRARRIFIPPNHGQPPGIGEIIVWISPTHRTLQDAEGILREGPPSQSEPLPPGNLYLLEDVRHPDDYHVMSSYSALSMMLGDMPGTVPEDWPEGELRGRQEALRYFDNLPRPAWGHSESFGERTEMQKKFMIGFLLNPAMAFNVFGAKVGPERSIRTLYRIRAIFREMELAIDFGLSDLATFGYPIFIAEAPPS